MAWLREEKLSWLQSMCMSILKAGPIPQHVALIMDGNRRFATKKHMNKVHGHVQGFEKLSQTLSWCRVFGINEVTVYAFSIENFKRTQEEVNGIMDLAREKFNQLLAERKTIMDYGLCIRFLGDLSLLPDDVQGLLGEVVHLSKNNNKSFLNVCFAYTSREEISAAIREMAIGVEKGLLQPSDVNESLLEKCLYTNQSKPPELLVRTSGEVRLSDFLLWQTAYSVLSFTKVLWPEFTFWHLAACIFNYQRQKKYLESFEERCTIERAKRERDRDYECVVEDLVKRKASIKDETFDLEEYVVKWRESREERVRAFLVHLNEERAETMKNFVNKRKV